MRKIVNVGDKQIFTITDETIDGLLFRIDPKLAAVVNRSELQNVRISLYRTQDGKKQMSLTPKGMTLAELYDVIFANDSERGVAILETPQKTEVSPDGFHILPYKFGVMNLSKGRGLLVEIENRGSVANPANKFVVEVSTSYAIGVESYLTKIEEVLLDSNATLHDESFGDNVIGIITKDLADLNRIDVISDKQNYEADETFVRSQIFDKIVVEDSGEPDYSLFLVHGGSNVLNKVRLKLEWDSQKSRQLFVIRRVTTPQILTNLIVKTKEHNEKNIKMIENVQLADDLTQKL